MSDRARRMMSMDNRITHLDSQSELGVILTGWVGARGSNMLARGLFGLVTARRATNAPLSDDELREPA